MKRVVVHIERLVLDGFARGDREGIAEGLRDELTRLLREPGAGERLARTGHLASLGTATIQLGSDAKAEGTGVSAARAISKGLSR